MSRRALKPITFAFSGLQLDMIGRANNSLPYIGASEGVKYHGYIRDKDVRRLRNWCDEILKARRK